MRCRYYSYYWNQLHPIIRPRFGATIVAPVKITNTHIPPSLTFHNSAISSWRLHYGSSLCINSYKSNTFSPLGCSYYSSSTKNIKKKKKKTLYDIIGVKKDATQAEIRRAYLKLAQLHHPDMCGPEGNAKLFPAISAAYDTLYDKDKRQVYDMRLEMGSSDAHREADIDMEWPSLIISLEAKEFRYTSARFLITNSGWPPFSGPLWLGELLIRMGFEQSSQDQKKLRCIRIELLWLLCLLLLIRQAYKTAKNWTFYKGDGTDVKLGASPEEYQRLVSRLGMLGACILFLILRRRKLKLASSHILHQELHSYVDMVARIMIFYGVIITGLSFSCGAIYSPSWDIHGNYTWENIIRNLNEIGQGTGALLGISLAVYRHKRHVALNHITREAYGGSGFRALIGGATGRIFGWLMTHILLLRLPSLSRSHISALHTAQEREMLQHLMEEVEEEEEEEEEEEQKQQHEQGILKEKEKIVKEQEQYVGHNPLSKAIFGWFKPALPINNKKQLLGNSEPS